MKVTVCEFGNDPPALERDWQGLATQVSSESSDLVLLPEMPFYPWVAQSNEANDAVWQASMDAHERWLSRLPELSPATVLGSRPVLNGGRRFNEGFIWDPASGYRAAHTKYYLPDEDGFWEASWYERGDGDFSPVRASEATVGFLICTEIWFGERARAYGKQGVHLLACPRATPLYSADRWLVGGRAAAAVGGAYCLSSNRSGVDGQGMEWGGNGWIIEPEMGAVLGLTSREQPFLTLEIDLNAAEAAKQTYPRYVPE